MSYALVLFKLSLIPVMFLLSLQIYYNPFTILYIFIKCMNVMYVTCYLHTPFYKYILMQFLCIVKFWQYKVYMLLDNKRNEKKRRSSFLWLFLWFPCLSWTDASRLSRWWFENNVSWDIGIWAEWGKVKLFPVISINVIANVNYFS